MQKKTVSEDLNKAAKNYADNITDKIGYKLQLRRAVAYGAKWQKEQMMAKAVDAKLLGGHLIRQKGFTHSLHVGDKVKVIIIKSE